MSLTSFPTSFESLVQNVRLGFIFVFSRFCFRRFVHSFPRLSKSNNKMTSRALLFSISEITSRNDFPPVFAEIIFPFTANVFKVSMSFFPSTIMGVPFAVSWVRRSKICRIFSSFCLRRVDKVFTWLFQCFLRCLGFLLLLWCF